MNRPVTSSGDIRASEIRRRPDPTEAAPYYYAYVERVPQGDICDLLERQRTTVGEMLGAVDESRSLNRYAPDKWSIREVVAHLIDTERLFLFRAFWFARGFDSPLPSFDQSVAAHHAGGHERALVELAQEFDLTRTASAAFYRSLSDDAWRRRGIASDHEFTVLALAYLAEGHVRHHLDIVRERYLQE